MQHNVNINGWLDLNLNQYKYHGVKRKMKHQLKYIWIIKSRENTVNGVKLLKKQHLDVKHKLCDKENNVERGGLISQTHKYQSN